jgi:hypothetical protein
MFLPIIFKYQPPNLSLSLSFSFLAAAAALLAANTIILLTSSSFPWCQLDEGQRR